MLTIATGKEVALLLFHTPTKYGRDPLACPNCQTIMELVEIWEPERRFVWMKRWLETHRRRKMAVQALARPLATRPKRYKLNSCLSLALACSLYPLYPNL